MSASQTIKSVNTSQDSFGKLLSVITSSQISGLEELISFRFFFVTGMARQNSLPAEES